MKAMKILIVEDELLTALHWKDILGKRGYTVTAIVSKGISALEEVAKIKPDLVLMDIRLKGDLDGIATAKKMHSQYSFPIIFITEWDDDKGKLFDDAKGAYPQSYITKPLEDRTLLHAVELAFQNSKIGDIDITHDAIFIPAYGKGRSKIKVLFDDILYITSDGPYSEIHIEPNNKNKLPSYIVTVNAGRLVRQLGYSPVMKVHKSSYVNINKIDELNTSSVFIRGQKIDVSKTYLSALKGVLTIVNHKK
jgi:DNA-binding LytR/AlgR family response regulator